MVANLVAMLGYIRGLSDWHFVKWTEGGSDYYLFRVRKGQEVHGLRLWANQRAG